MIELKKKLEDTINEYIKRFEEKQEMYFEFWVGDIVGEICVFGDHYFNFSDIRYDLETNQEVGEIIDWYWYAVDQEKDYINYSSWCKGLKDHLPLKRDS